MTDTTKRRVVCAAIRAADALEQQAADLAYVKAASVFNLMEENKRQAAQIAMLEQRATCGCGDQFTAHDPGTCGNCCAAADRSNEIEALRADAERMTTALNKIAERQNSDWPDRCQAMVNTARAALRQEQPNE